ncbi:hypothetical protein MJO29_008337 [Puccinia striiformis f. sp. tritici]|uniref:Uncharacterized protein n=1 Tax=Puccinia striiformis f. sp. tritici PST-78 TaxID=1165861 RepID=A0A0L0UXA0_9BASI|nr:hypothetical protein MJO29_008337 [Puccinia striiformis f. sp. tritici]KNE91369.1 hypothetical protein PSTG_15234 [Puccinia striiformis f. sp. tritici PST-78]
MSPHPPAAPIPACPVTVLEGLVDSLSPQTSTIMVDYSLYLRAPSAEIIQQNTAIMVHPPFTHVSPVHPLGPMTAILQGPLWRFIQLDVIDHIGTLQRSIMDPLHEATTLGQIRWMVAIEDHPKFIADSYITIKNHVDFLKFVLEAHDAYPSRILLKLVMTPPEAISNAIIASVSPSKSAGNAWHIGNGFLGSGLSPTKSAGRSRDHVNIFGNNGTSSSSCNSPAALAPANQSSLLTHSMAHLIDTHNTPVAPAPNGRRRPAPDDEIEIIEDPHRGRRARIDPLGVANPLHPPAMGPASHHLELVELETYLWMAHIEPDDHATRERLRANGITHWTFFRRSSEEELTQLGFPLGICRLLCEGVGRLERNMGFAMPESEDDD